MTGRSVLADMAAGAPGGFDRVLHNCRFEGLGAVAYGAEAIRALLQSRCCVLQDCREAAHPCMAALIGEASPGVSVALFADVHQGWITRLWVLGPWTANEPPLPKTDVPADLDLDQRGGSLGFDPSDHPHLDPAHASCVTQLGNVWLHSAPADIVAPLQRPRPIVARAFSDGDTAAALFRLQGAAPHGLAGFYAAALLDGRDTAVVIDAAGRRAAIDAPWTPSLRPSALS